MNFSNAVIYQIYPKSFQDSNQDGIGDIPGIISRLDYLAQLGIDYLWLTPIYPSPQKDNGYDISNYYEIDPVYGTMEDFKTLVFLAGKLGIKIIMDMVFNHTSTEHAWFQRALSGDKKYQDYYIFRPGSNGSEPNNWQSKFGGSAWEFVPQLGLYYLHLFDKTQADLNWDNPEVRRELYKIIHYWIGLGVKGFRFDVINLISKPQFFADDPSGDGHRFYTDGPHIHQYLKEMHQQTFGRYPDILTVGEMSSTSLRHALQYSDPRQGELSMLFHFHHLRTDYKNDQKWELEPLRFMELKELFAKWQTAMENNGSWDSLFWCNHDQPRIVSRFGSDSTLYREKSAKMLATAIQLMRGTPYIYQGEEIGMTNAYFTQIAQYRDVESLNFYSLSVQKGMDPYQALKVLQARSRDNARTPMQWDASRFAGFSTVQPWIETNPNYQAINVEASQKNSNSILRYYQKLIVLRKQSSAITNGGYCMLCCDHPEVYAYRRYDEHEEIVVFCNFTAKTTNVDFPMHAGFSFLLSNDIPKPAAPLLELSPYEAIVFYKKRVAL